jgi:hypothetical protein
MWSLLQKARMSKETREMNQGMSGSINTLIRLAYDLDRREVRCWTYEDNFVKESVIGMIGEER